MLPALIRFALDGRAVILPASVFVLRTSPTLVRALTSDVHDTPPKHRHAFSDHGKRLKHLSQACLKEEDAGGIVCDRTSTAHIDRDIYLRYGETETVLNEFDLQLIEAQASQHKNQSSFSWYPSEL